MIIKPGDEIPLGAGQRFRVLDVVPFAGGRVAIHGAAEWVGPSCQAARARSANCTRYSRQDEGECRHRDEHQHELSHAGQE
jgi:hypothetical protein